VGGVRGCRCWSEGARCCCWCWCWWCSTCRCGAGVWGRGWWFAQGIQAWAGGCLPYCVWCWALLPSQCSLSPLAGCAEKKSTHPPLRKRPLPATVSGHTPLCRPCTVEMWQEGPQFPQLSCWWIPGGLGKGLGGLGTSGEPTTSQPTAVACPCAAAGGLCWVKCWGVD
jgi:hypothetical protein